MNIDDIVELQRAILFVGGRSRMSHVCLMDQFGRGQAANRGAGDGNDLLEFFGIPSGFDEILAREADRTVMSAGGLAEEREEVDEDGTASTESRLRAIA